MPRRSWHSRHRTVAKGKPWGDLTSHSRRRPNAPEMLVFPPQGHLVLQGERDRGGFGTDELAMASSIPRQPGPSPPSPPDSQRCTLPSRSRPTTPGRTLSLCWTPCPNAESSWRFCVCPGPARATTRTRSRCRQGRQRGWPGCWSRFPALIALLRPWGGAGVRVPREAAALSLASSGKADKGQLQHRHHAAVGSDPTSSTARSGGFLPLASAVASSSAGSDSSTWRSSPCLGRLSA